VDHAPKAGLLLKCRQNLEPHASSIFHPKFARTGAIKLAEHCVGFGALIFTADHHEILGLHGRLIGRLFYGDKSMRECGGRDLDLDYIPDLQIIYDERLPERRILPMVKSN
jgi:hypothetical protein